LALGVNDNLRSWLASTIKLRFRKLNSILKSTAGAMGPSWVMNSRRCAARSAQSLDCAASRPIRNAAENCWRRAQVGAMRFPLIARFAENMSLENVTLPAEASTTYHSHDQDLVFVVTAGAKIKNQVLDK